MVVSVKKGGERREGVSEVDDSALVPGIVSSRPNSFHPNIILVIRFSF